MKELNTTAGYGYPPTRPLEFTMDPTPEGGTEWYFFSPVTEVNVTLSKPGTAVLHTRRVGRNGQVYENEVPMFDDGDGLNFSYAYSPAMIVELETSVPVQNARIRQ